MENKEFMKQMKEDTLNMMLTAERELYRIIEPINDTRKLKYSVTSKFLANGDLTKAWEQIKKIVEAHQWLSANVDL